MVQEEAKHYQKDDFFMHNDVPSHLVRKTNDKMCFKSTQLMKKPAQPTWKFVEHSEEKGLP